MKGLIKFFVNNPLVVKVFLIVSFVGGLFALNGMERESFPKVDFNIVLVQTIYPGASPLDVELNISKKIEEELQGIDGIDKYLSTSSENISMVTVWIEIDEEDPEKVKRDIQKAVDRAKVTFPAKAEQPQVLELKTQNIPIVRYVLSSDVASETELRKITRDLEDVIKDKVSSVSQVNKVAYRDPQIKISADLMKLQSNRISLQDIANAIKNYNVRLGGGSIQSFAEEKNIVTISEFNNIEEVSNVILRSNFQSMNVRIKDVADVTNDFSERTIYARGNQHNGIIIEILKKEGKDVINTVDNVTQVVTDFEKDLNLKAKKTKLAELAYKSKNQAAIDFTKVFINRSQSNGALSLMKVKMEGMISSLGFVKDDYKIISTADITKNTRKLLKTTSSHGIEGFIFVFIFLVLFLEFTGRKSYNSLK